MIWTFAKKIVLLQSETKTMKENQFIHRISKEQIQTLPVVGFEGEVQVIDRPEQVEAAVAYLQTRRILGVDTEARPSFTRGVHYPTALVQVSSEERCYLFRLTHVGMPKELCEVFANPQICKVGLAFKDDLHGLRRRRNFEPKNCVDLQSIGIRYGILDMGLQKMFAICFGKKISKAQQLTNWENSHLTPEQARYASTDAWATLMIYKELMKTQPLPKKEAEAIRRADLEKQQQHQQEVMAARAAQMQQEGQGDTSSEQPASTANGQ
ncbi:MAG: 3'-5' exonuclease domain-containing protein 2 [Paludibacteraceae bacterium]|nr:3'-5' exonuclease domain-containing protein 2 [Paludibacteraceae bacterium]